VKNIFVLIYSLLLGVHLYAGYNDYQQLEMISKPTLLIWLIVFFALNTHKKKCGVFKILILLGLIFSLAGDVLLIFQKEQSGYFMTGLIAFVIAHVFYVWAFTKTYLNNHEIPLIKRQGWVMILILAYGILFFRAIKEHVGSFIGPVILYTAVITLMLLMAVNRYGRVGRISFWLVTLGAVLFVASDSILAWNKFVHPLPNSHFLIMATYGLAQLFIVLGAMRQVQQVHSHS